MIKQTSQLIWISLAGAAINVPGSSARAASPPTEQTAVVQRGYGGTEVLKIETIPVRKPGDGQVLVQIYAAGVNPVDWKSREGINGRRIGTPAPVGRPQALRIPGSDIAGVVAQLGPGVTNLKIGDPVAGAIGGGITGLNGSYAHYALAAASSLIPKPKNLTYAEAAGLGTVAGTPVLAIFRLRIQSGQTLLITGVAGGVGSAMAQLAKAEGAKVIGTASARHNGFLEAIGVDKVVDYTQGDWASQVKNADAVFDTVGSTEGEEALGTLKPSGEFMGIATENGEPSDEQCSAARVTCVPLRPARRGDPTGFDRLSEAGRLANEGKLTMKVDRLFPLEQAAAAQELSREGHTEGKIVLSIDRKASTK